MKTNILFALLFATLFGFAGGPTRLLKRQVNGPVTYVAYTETGGPALLGAHYLSAADLPAVKLPSATIGAVIQDNKAESLHAGPFTMVFYYLPVPEIAFCLFFLFNLLS